MNSIGGVMVVRAMALSCLVCAGVPRSCERSNCLFTEVSRSAGIDFLYNFGDYTYQNILESSGSGITVFDYNGDGYMDLYMMNGTWLEGISDDEGRVFENSPNRLYRNMGDGTFTEVSEVAGVDDRHWSMAAGPIDYDLDGDQDLFLLNYGPNRFYRNNGDGTFSDVTEITGLQGPDSLNGCVKWSVAVSFWDYNSDGRTDAFVGNFLAFDPSYVSPANPGMMPHPSEYRGQASLLYEQEEDGSFREVTRQAGLYYPDSKCMGLTVFDYDLDGDPDLFQGNDHQANFLFSNKGGQFEELAVQAGVAVNSRGQGTGSMHGALGDVDGDGYIDLLVPDLRYGALYKSLGNGTYRDITESSGVAAAFSGKGQWTAALLDFDNDGDLDIFAANGIAEVLVEQTPLLLENDGSGNFRDAGKALAPYFKGKRSGRAAATWDYDNDGDVDIIISHVDLKAHAVLLRNDCRKGNHWMGLILAGRNGSSSAIGARVVVHTDSDSLVYVNQWTTSYLTNNDPRIHVGLGKSSSVDRIVVHWPDGSHESFPGPGVDRYHTIRQGEGHNSTDG